MELNQTLMHHDGIGKEENFPCSKKFVYTLTFSGKYLHNKLSPFTRFTVDLFK